jgi:HAD superfamily hydrolase (TIGR01458 family)
MGARYANILIDLAGVLYQGTEPVPGAPRALARLRAAGCRVVFVTNTTRQPRDELVASLAAMGFDIAADEVLTAAQAARRHLTSVGQRAHLLVHPRLEPELADLVSNTAQCVVVGDAGEGFSYANLNRAFRTLMAASAPELVALGDNRYFAENASLSLDMGPFVHALAYAADVEPLVVGKPAASFFEAGLAQLGAAAADTIMIGDDIASDVGGAQHAGLAGVLVRTGKYRAGDEDHPTVRADQVRQDFPAAVDWLLDAGADH